MRFVSFLLFLTVCLMSLACGSGPGANSNAADTAQKKQNALGGRETVLVELFTSEGCGNCPPADKQLGYLETEQPYDGVDVITLGYHVDYFDDRGWKDIYGSPDHTKRQQLYSMRMNVDNIYTPQMVVDGSSQFIGSNREQAGAEITKASRSGKGTIEAVSDGRTAQVTISGLGQHNVATAVVVAVEDGLVSNVKAGNNNGKTLAHTSVVRKLVGFGKVPEKASGMKGAVELPTDPAWKTENVRHIIYVQEDMSGKIIAVGRVKKA